MRLDPAPLAVEVRDGRVELAGRLPFRGMIPRSSGCVRWSTGLVSVSAYVSYDEDDTVRGGDAAMRRDIVAGLDGTAESEEAAEWAASVVERHTTAPGTCEEPPPAVTPSAREWQRKAAAGRHTPFDNCGRPARSPPRARGHHQVAT
ncbi:hypothetical protein AQF52_6875 [Streptomyces venezuelae]|nr:hypothetical protein AQF52_6875 [Streptomyces venezuelae]CUM36914.1 Inosine-5'-monophosphate dehydrogenase [Streptomyces venezuelae]